MLGLPSVASRHANREVRAGVRRAAFRWDVDAGISGGGGAVCQVETAAAVPGVQAYVTGSPPRRTSQSAAGVWSLRALKLGIAASSRARSARRAACAAKRIW
jgi:hypothetical protein